MMHSWGLYFDNVEAFLRTRGRDFFGASFGVVSFQKLHCREFVNALQTLLSYATQLYEASVLASCLDMIGLLRLGRT